MRLSAAALVLSLAGCAHDIHPMPVPPGPTTIADMTAFLAPPGRHDGDPAQIRRFDWGMYQAADAFQIDATTFAGVWSYPPFGPFVAEHGDGGEVYVVDNNTVRVVATQDGGTPYLQGFYGDTCGGTGWVYFRNDAPTGRWASIVARLSDLQIPSACSAENTAFTRYRLERISLPFLSGGEATWIPLTVVISEHYNGPSIEKSSALERAIFAQGYGRLVWEAWSTTAEPRDGLAHDCPATEYSVPPAPGYRLVDCRFSTNLMPTDTVAPFGWPPAESTWP